MVIQDDWDSFVITLKCRDFDEMRGAIAILSTLEGIKSGRYRSENIAIEQLLSLLKEVEFKQGQG